VSRTLAIAVVALLGLAPAAHAARADLLVVGKGGTVLRAAKPVTLKRATVKVGTRRCQVAATTPLAALARTTLVLKLRDYGSCSSRPADATALYVRGIGKQVERGTDGWVFKIGRRTPSTGAGDPLSKLRDGTRLLWFWCRNGAAGCQRSLEAQPAATAVAGGSELRVTVRGYDDNGKGQVVPGATVRLGSATATTGADGVATVTVPAGAATLSLMATKPGLVPAFPVKVSAS
jgi:hypothetical protein